MPRQANGSYQQPANTSAISGSSISSTAYNTLISDIGTELTNSLDRGGRSAMSAALPMGNNKITGMADPTTSTDGATKNYIDTIIAALFSTGDLKPTHKASADAGWILWGDGSIGNAGSAATIRANADTQALYTIYWSRNYTGINISGGRGASAAADFAANKTLNLPPGAGRALVLAGAGSGLTTRVISESAGEETHLLTTAEIPAHYHGAGIFDPGHTHTYQTLSGGLRNDGTSALTVNTSFVTQTTGGAATGVRVNSSNGLDTTYNAGGGGAHNNMQPSAFINVMIKL